MSEPNCPEYSARSPAVQLYALLFLWIVERYKYRAKAIMGIPKSFFLIGRKSRTPVINSCFKNYKITLNTQDDYVPILDVWLRSLLDQVFHRRDGVTHLTIC